MPGISFLRNLISPRALMASVLVAVFAGSSIFMAGCEEEKYENDLPESCVYVLGSWVFEFGEPLNMTIRMVSFHDNFTPYTPTPIPAGANLNNQENCSVFFRDTSADRHAFRGNVDGTKLRMETKVGSTWKIRGDVAMEFSPTSGMPTTNSRITGYWTLDDSWSGTFTARLEGL